MSNETEELGHGSSTASWTAVVIMLVAFSIGTIAFFFSVVWLVWASAGLVVVGLLVGYGLAKAGYGVGGSRVGGSGVGGSGVEGPGVTARGH